jgi:hypothetical protein
MTLKLLNKMLERRRPAYLGHTKGHGGSGGGERVRAFGRDHGVNNITLASSPLGRSQDPDQPNKAGDGRGSLRNERPPAEVWFGPDIGETCFCMGPAVIHVRLLRDLENPQSM